MTFNHHISVLVVGEDAGTMQHSLRHDSELIS